MDLVEAPHQLVGELVEPPADVRDRLVADAEQAVQPAAGDLQGGGGTVHAEDRRLVVGAEARPQLRGRVAQDDRHAGGEDVPLAQALVDDAHVHELRQLVDKLVALVGEVRGAKAGSLGPVDLAVEDGHLLGEGVDLADGLVELVVEALGDGGQLVRDRVDLLGQADGGAQDDAALGQVLGPRGELLGLVEELLEEVVDRPLAGPQHRLDLPQCLEARLDARHVSTLLRVMAASSRLLLERRTRSTSTPVPTGPPTLRERRSAIWRW